MIVLGVDVLMTSASKASAVRVVGSSVAGVPDPPHAANAARAVRTKMGFVILGSLSVFLGKTQTAGVPRDPRMVIHEPRCHVGLVSDSENTPFNIVRAVKVLVDGKDPKGLLREAVD